MIARWLALSITLVTFAAPASAVKFAGAFMDLGGGARALGMGGAFAAVAADASTVYWNPAGIAGIEHRQVLAMHAEQFGDMVDYNFGAYVQPTTLLDPARKPAFGFALLHVGVPDIPVTHQFPFTDLNGDGNFDPGQGEELLFDVIPMESDNSFALLNAFALETGAGAVGGTLKLIYTDAIAGESSMGIGIDLGYLRRDFLVRDLSVGAKLQDATGTYLSWSTGTNEFITPMLKVGTAYRLASEKFRGALLLAADADVYFDDRRTGSQFWIETFSADLHLGAELSFEDKAMVRGGFDAGRGGFEELNGTAGAGIYFGFLGLDYAYLHHDAFEATHRVSMLANF